MEKYVYPQFPAVFTTPFFRIGGSGLANCLFVYGRAIVSAHKYNAKIIAPQWLNFKPGTYIRHEKDKRHYYGIFHHKGEITGIKKCLLLAFCKKVKNFEEFEDGLIIESGIHDFFNPLLGNHQLIREYIADHLCEGILDNVNQFDFSNCIAVHIRLGDFPESRRIPIEWYKKKIMQYSNNRRVLLFSDGSNKELAPLLELKNTEKVYFGGAIQDIFAISRCQFLIGSDSSFSSWGAFLGQVPCCFYRLQFGNFLNDKYKLINENEQYYK